MRLQDTKRGLKWWFFNYFGPPEVQNLVNYIDEITNDGELGIALYPSGVFQFNVMVSNGKDIEPLYFRTDEERVAFQAGMNSGVNLMGGTAQALDSDTFEEMKKMGQISTHNGGGGRNN